MALGKHASDAGVGTALLAEWLSCSIEHIGSGGDGDGDGGGAHPPVCLESLLASGAVLTAQTRMFAANWSCQADGSCVLEPLSPAPSTHSTSSTRPPGVAVGWACKLFKARWKEKRLSRS